MRRAPEPLPAPYRAWFAEAGRAGLPHALASAFGDADARWRHTQLPLFDPTTRRGPALPPVADPGALYTALHPDRRASGAYYTPAAVVDAVVALAWDGAGAVHDPACGAGAFLLGALRTLPASERAAFATTRLSGTDIDPLAVALAQAQVAVAAELGLVDCQKLRSRITVSDALHQPAPTVDTILTNPPFLTRLRTLTAVDAALATQLKARFGKSVGPYTDVSVVFLLDCVRAATRRVGIVLPASACATRDAAAARAACPAPSFVWTLPKGCFADVGVPLVALGFVRDAEGPTRRYAFLPPRLVSTEAVAPEAAWNALLVTEGGPTWCPPAASGTLGDVASIEADFRDEFYALQGHIVEDGPGLRVITSGLIDVGEFTWGERPARIHKRTWLRPTAPFEALHPRQAARIRPRVLVATQTKVLEAAADPDCRCVGLTPVLTVTPESWSLAAVFAVLVSPPVSAWAQRESAGSGLALDAVKLSASQLRRAPLPPTIPDEAIAAAQAVIDGDRSALAPLAALMNAAYGAPDGVLDWWRTAARRSGRG